MRNALVIAGSIIMLSGCRSFSTVKPNEAVAPATTVAITFASARDLGAGDADDAGRERGEVVEVAGV